MIIKPDSTILFQGDSITDAGRRRDFGDAPIPANDIHALGRGYSSLVAARLLADRLGVPEERRIVCFQSRLGRDPWIRPYTDELVAAEARSGTKRALILSPAFVADCLETLEELGLRAADSFVASGGEALTLVPSLNARDDWADAVVTIAREHSSWLDEALRRAAGERRASAAAE